MHVVVEKISSLIREEVDLASVELEKLVLHLSNGISHRMMIKCLTNLEECMSGDGIIEAIS